MDNKKIAHKLWETIGGKPKVVEYFNESNEDSKIDIYIGENRPYDGVISYGTIGLSNYDIGLELPNKKALRVEFIGACGSYYKEFANIMSSCAFNIMDEQYSCKPGIVYPDIVSQYYKESEMKHIMFVLPFLWDDLEELFEQHSIDIFDLERKSVVNIA